MTTMRLLVLALLITGTARAEDKVFSGPQPGEKLSSFKAVGVYDDDEGKERDVIKEADGKATMIVFVHELTRPSAALMRGLSGYAASREKDGLKTYFVWLSKDRTETVAFLKRARMSLNLKSPVVISLDGQEGPGAYGLNRKVGLTILVAKDNKVMANAALTQPALSDGPPITEQIAKLVGGKGLDLKQFETLVMGQRPRAPQTDEKLATLLRRVINKNIDADAVKKAAEEVEKYIADDKDKQKEVVRISKVIVEKEYGTEAAQKQAKKWIEQYSPKKD